ncbi:MAG: NAD(P)/FAD-dependent oxidoreductase, partial [Steroidobacteraceae bacterium]
MQAHFDAVIMGAGPAGSTAAILLARAGWSVALVERREFPRRKVCGECIAASNLPLLDALGIGEDFETRAGPQLGRVALMRGKDTIEGDMPPFNHPRYAWGKALGRETLDTLLLARAREAGAVVLQPWSVRSLSGLPGAYRCDIRAAGSREVGCLQASIVIDARGSWEPVRSHSTVPH